MSGSKKFHNLITSQGVAVYFVAVLVKRANDTLQQLHVAPRVKHWSDIGADVFVTLFEGISGEPLRGMYADLGMKLLILN